MSRAQNPGANPLTSALKFHPFYTFTNEHAFKHILQEFQLLMYQMRETHQMEGRVGMRQTINHAAKARLFSYLEALEFRYRRDMPHVLSSMHHLLICMDMICDATRSNGEDSHSTSTLTELCMSSSILRFVTGLAEVINQNYRGNGKKAPSLKASLHRIQIPEYIISLRNRISHDVMPAYGVLVRATQDSLKWIDTYFWEELLRNVRVSDNVCHEMVLQYGDGTILFDALRDEDRWQVARLLVQREIFDGEMEVGSSLVERLLKDDNFENGERTGKSTNRPPRLQLSACILSEIANHLLSRALERKVIEHALKWFKWILDGRMQEVWCIQLRQHLRNRRTTLSNNGTLCMICDLMVALLDKQCSARDISTNSQKQSKKRRKVSEDKYVHGEDDSRRTHIPHWELVTEEEAFELPIGHVLPYAAHSDFTFEHFQLTDEDLEKQFVRCGE